MCASSVVVGPKKCGSHTESMICCRECTAPGSWANPNGADAVAAATKATKAADAARERTAEYLLATRLEQLREQTVPHMARIR